MSIYSQSLNLLSTENLRDYLGPVSHSDMPLCWQKEELQVYEKYCQNKPRSEVLWRQCGDSLFFQVKHTHPSDRRYTNQQFPSALTSSHYSWPHIILHPHIFHVQLSSLQLVTNCDELSRTWKMCRCNIWRSGGLRLRIRVSTCICT